MSNSCPTEHLADSFGSGKHTESMWQAMDQIRSKFERRIGGRGGRAGRGDVRTAVLALLVEEPMHDYQIIREIEDRSGGNWKPSAGSVYPTLQLLTDEGLISAEESNGRKTYTLTDEGREAAAKVETPAQWDSADGAQSDAAGGTGSGFGALSKAGMELAQAATQVGRSGTPDQVREAVIVLEESRRRLYAILAQD